MKTPEAPFFLAINHQRKTDNPVWYRRAPLGKNEIGKFLSKAATNAGIEGNITNHSVRKTCISRLMDADIPTNYVAQLSGHKNLKSLDSCKRLLVFINVKCPTFLSRSSFCIMKTTAYLWQIFLKNRIRQVLPPLVIVQ